MVNQRLCGSRKCEELLVSKDCEPEELGDLHLRLKAVELAVEHGVLEASIKLRELHPTRPVDPQILELWLRDYERASALDLGAMGIADAGRN